MQSADEDPDRVRADHAQEEQPYHPCAFPVLIDHLARGPVRSSGFTIESAQYREHETKVMT